jgi:hypothetical protein
MTDEKLRLMAFWDYDRFPYTLYSEVDRFVEGKKNVAKVRGYGGATFKYKFLLPIDVGEALADELRRLEKEYSREKTELSMRYHERLAMINLEYGFPGKHI